MYYSYYISHITVSVFSFSHEPDAPLLVPEDDLQERVVQLVLAVVPDEAGGRRRVAVPEHEPLLLRPQYGQLVRDQTHSSAQRRT